MEFQEYQNNTTQIVDLSRIVSLLAIVNKYQFASYEKWSLETLIKRTNAPLDPHAMEGLPSALLERLLHLSVICEAPALQENVQDMWINILCAKNSEDGSARIALDVGEQLNLRQFQGRVYYQLSSEMECQCRASGLSVCRPPEQNLSPEQQMCLFHGSWSIGQYVNDVMKHLINPASPPMEDTYCNKKEHRMICRPQWQPIMVKALCKLTSLDPLEALGIMVGTTDSLPFCLYSIFASCEEELRTELEDHFLGSE